MSISSIFLFSRNTKMMRNRNCFAEFRLFLEIKKRQNFVSPCFAKLKKMRNFVSHCFAEIKLSRFRKSFRKKDNFVHIFAHKNCYVTFCEIKKLELGRRERFRVFASPTRKHFDDAKREDAPPLKTTRSRKTRRVTDAKFRVTGVGDIS